MSSRSFHPVIVITFMLGVMSSCTSDPDGTEQVTTTEITTMVDTGTPEDMADEEQAQRLDYWIQEMDQYVTEHSDWTYDFNQPAFLADMATTYPDVYDYYVNGGAATTDTEVIDGLIEGLPIVNQYALEQYNELTANGTVAPPPSTWRTWYWWGYKQCFTGSDASTAKYQICAGAIVTGIWFAIPSAYLGYCCLNADSCLDDYGQFCVKWTWTLNWVWVTCY